jgi:signal peptidase I
VQARRGSLTTPRRVRLALAAAVVAGAAALAGSGLAAPVRISSGSMAPTLLEGDRVLVTRAGAGAPGRGELVTFRSPADGALTLKRVVAVAGDRVAIEDAALVVNGRPVTEPYVDASRIDGLYFGPVTVPAGTVFVLGDQRAGSIDSRVFGAVPVASVGGRVLVRLWPPLRLSSPAQRPK